MNYSISDVNSSKSFARLIASIDGYGKGPGGQSELLDIYDLASNIKERFPDSSEIVNKIQKMLTYTVVNTTNGKSKPNANGLSIYFPKDYGSYSSQSVVNSLDTWQQIVNKKYYFLNLDKKHPNVASQTIGNTITGWVDLSDVSNVTLYIERSGRNLYYTEEIDPSKIISKNGYFRYFWDGDILSLCSRESCSPTTMTFDSNGMNKFALFPVTIVSPKNYINSGFSLLYEINEVDQNIRFLGAVPQIKTEDTVSKERYTVLPNSIVYTAMDPTVSFTFLQNLLNKLSLAYPEKYVNSTVLNVCY